MTFKATANSGGSIDGTTLTIAPAGPEMSDPIISGNEFSQTVTFVAGTEGTAYTCTLNVKHPENGKDCTGVSGRDYTYTVYVPKIVVYNPNNSPYPKKLYYLQNPSNPAPVDVEYNRYQLKGVDGLDLSQISWKCSPSILNIIAEAGHEDDVNVKATGDNGANDTEIFAAWKGNDIASTTVRVRTKGEISRDRSIDEYSYTDYIVWVGWESITGYKVTDQFDADIGAVGVSEQLYFNQRTDYWANHNWFSGSVNTGNFLTYSNGTFPDHYSIYGANLIPYATNKEELHNVSEQLVSSVPQKYRVGSLTAGDGMLFREHNIIWKRGYADSDPSN